MEIPDRANSLNYFWDFEINSGRLSRLTLKSIQSKFPVTNLTFDLIVTENICNFVCLSCRHFFFVLSIDVSVVDN